MSQNRRELGAQHTVNNRVVTVADAAGGDLYAHLASFGRVEIDLFDPQPGYSLDTKLQLSKVTSCHAAIYESVDWCGSTTNSSSLAVRVIS
jgi:hypothetical protein